MEGKAVKKIDADGMRFEIEFFKKGTNLTECMKSVKEQINEFLEKAESLGFDISQFHIESDEAEANRHSYEKDVQYMKEISYESVFDMSVENTIMQLIRDNHYEVRADTIYLYSSEETVRKDLIACAVEDSREKAERAAETAGETIVGVASIDAEDNYSDFTESENLSLPTFLSKSIEVETSERLSAKQKLISEKIEVVWKTKKQ